VEVSREDAPSGGRAPLSGHAREPEPRPPFGGRGARPRLRAARDGAAGELRGFVLPGFEPVAEQFERNLLERGDTGAAFAAFVDGSPVVDVWGGLADRARRHRWRHDTLVGIYSGTKGFVATCLLLLIERGLLELDAPVRAY
jgi:CubicO group peptidase (beta-lactamase class C family)